MNAENRHELAIYDHQFAVCETDAHGDFVAMHIEGQVIEAPTGSWEVATPERVRDVLYHCGSLHEAAQRLNELENLLRDARNQGYSITPNNKIEEIVNTGRLQALLGRSADNAPTDTTEIYAWSDDRILVPGTMGDWTVRDRFDD